MEPFIGKEVESMVEANGKVMYWPDRDGLTPILRAYKAGNLFTAAFLCNLSPEAATIVDPDGNTFWHLLVKHPSHYFVHRLLQKTALREVLKQGDKDGKTPLFLALENNRFDILEDFLDIWERQRNELPATYTQRQPECRWLVDLLKIPNKAGKTSEDLIAESTCLPSKNIIK
ncbi:hypothetical protein RDABS01_015852 [Bienertia sinuspersici]